MISIIPATPDMVREYCRGEFTTQAMAVVDGEKILAVYGIYIQETSQVVFSNISDELKNKPKNIIRAWRGLLNILKSKNLPIFARCDLTVPKADTFMLHLGFIPFNGDIWKMEGEA